MAGRIPPTGGGLDTVFKDLDMTRRIDSELSLTIHGDLGRLSLQDFCLDF
jgi:hypothetical protein